MKAFIVKIGHASVEFRVVVKPLPTGVRAPDIGVVAELSQMSSTAR